MQVVYQQSSLQVVRWLLQAVNTGRSQTLVFRFFISKGIIILIQLHSGYKMLKTGANVSYKHYLYVIFTKLWSTKL